MKKRFISFVVLLGLLSLGLSACSKDNDKNTKSVAKSDAKPVANSGRFINVNSKTIYGDELSNSVYKENELTLVNIMATWCGPCVRELPELQKIHEENNGFGVVGIVIDTFDEMTGKTIETAVNEAKNIAQKTGAKYPLAIPTRDFLEQTMKKAAALLPMSFIVDKDGKIVKGPIAGARTEDQWLDVLNSVKTTLK